ncbi:hypothetical protein GH733_000625, partial [Mirounga leonina]
MGPDATVAWRRSLLLPRLLLWSGLALGALALVSSPHRVLHDLLSEQQLLEVEDLSLTLLQGGRLGPLSLPPDLPDLDPECRELLLDFANSSAELTGCLVRSARPVRLCQTCYPLFQQVANKMDNISRAVGGNIHSLLQLRNYSEVCKNCREAYKTLSSLYNEMQKMNELENKAESGTHLCIDVEDAMNITRKLWSRTFNCSVPCSDTVPVIAVSVFILFLPVVFYLSSFLHSEQKKRKLIL